MSYIESYVSDDEEDYVETQGYDRRGPPPPQPPAKSMNGSVYGVGNGPSIIMELRNVGVNVLSIESNSDILSYLDAVATETLSGEQCLLYTDGSGKTFNVVVSVSCTQSFFLSSIVVKHILLTSPFQILFTSILGRSRRTNGHIQFGQGNIFRHRCRDFPTLRRPSAGVYSQSFVLIKL